MLDELNERSYGNGSGSAAPGEIVTDRVAAALRESRPRRPDAHDEIMRAVHRTPEAARRTVLARRRRVRRYVLAGVAELALAAAAVAVTLLLDARRTAPREGAPVRPAAAPAADAAWPGAAAAIVVPFVLAAPTAASVALVSDFNSWDRTSLPLHRVSGAVGDLWAIEVPVPPGRHEYAFVVDGRRWVADPLAARAPASEFGATNSVLVVRGPTGAIR